MRNSLDLDVFFKASFSGPLNSFSNKSHVSAEMAMGKGGIALPSVPKLLPWV